MSNLEHLVSEGLDMLAQWLMMVLWLAVIVAIPVGWFLVGLKSYGTGDYHQP